MKFQATLLGKEYFFATKPGLFSKESVDTGSQLLINTMKITDGDRVIDLGCGYGPVGFAAASLTPTGSVMMIDVDIRAIKYSRINAKVNNIRNVEIEIGDGFENISPNKTFDVVLSNPPSHVPKETIIEFIEGAKERLNKGGRLYFVTEKRIRPMIKRELERVFGNYDMIASEGVYAISMAKV